MEFVHLHVHSHYSLLNGLTKIKPLVKFAKENGFKALALTDSNALYGAIEFYQACIAEEIKPIIGAEIFVCNSDNYEKDPEIFQLVLLAQNFSGYQNLMRIISFSQVEGYTHGIPRIDKNILKKYSLGLIAMSGNIKGEIPQLLIKDKYEEAKKSAVLYNEIFGQDNFYLEMQDHLAVEGQLKANTGMLKISEETKIPCVVTRDVHYLRPEDAEAQDILFCIGKGWKINDAGRENYRHVDRSLNSVEDIFSRFRHAPQAIENTIKIANKIDLKIELNAWHFAPVTLPAGKTAGEALHEETYKNASKYYADLNDEIKKRIEYELDIIKTKGYAPYFLCVADYVGFAKQNGIVESTRGSAAGSIVSYILGITTVDPIRFKLPFERFLNPYRPSPPDIDTDFADDRREEMINYITNKYGADKVAQIITFGTMAARASIRDVGRVLGFSYSFCDQVAKLIPMGSQGFPMTIERALKEEPDLKKLYDNNFDVKRLIDLAKKVEGCARHTSIHAAGVVIAPTALTDFTPIQKETGGEKIITQYEMKSVEAAGLLKNDFLGIRNLAILGNAVEIVEKTIHEKIDIYNLPLDDKKTFEMISNGETIGLFQLNGSGMTRWVKELRPSRIEDIMAMVALYRPGPMDAIPEYIRRKHNPKLVEYIDKRLEKILDASYGLLVYQDDVMLTAIELAGYDWMEADKFRKAMGKKIPTEMQKQKIKFYQGCRTHGGLKDSIIDSLWKAIEPFASYGFNKAHAASYGIVAYQTAYMKAHYPVQYMTAVLAAEYQDSEKVAILTHECTRMGISVLPPDVNESFRNFAMVSKPEDGGRIRFGLNAIKNVGSHICEVIYRERKNNGPYGSLEDFLKRITDKDLNKKSLESLIQAGAMDCFGHDRGVLLANIENILGFVKNNKEQAVSMQNSLFANTNIAIEDKVSLQNARNATIEEKLLWEKNLLGLYVSSHPFAKYYNAIKDCLTDIADLENYERNKWVAVGGVIDKIVKKITKKGGVMLFATIQDQTGSIEALVFPKTYEETKELWKQGEVVCISARIPKEEGDNKLFVEQIYIVNEQTLKNVKNQLSAYKNLNDAAAMDIKKEKSIILYITKEKLKLHGEFLKALFQRHPGEYGIYIRVGNDTIKAQSSVDASAQLLEELGSVLGNENVKVE
jgi:DNA polymerase-3 subunit alpha